ncbi:hypothetical protein [Rufibacter roseus]|uniref:Uncharacterized protein n=1 Tax=Rufibacter roseus TaxID=1567108 RepID=A0ABW2DJR6_9BACT|nr:hypothetical protein [Rufibacter roseus]
MAQITLNVTQTCINGGGRFVVSVNTTLTGTIRVYAYTLPTITEDGEEPGIELFQDIFGSESVIFTGLKDTDWHIYAKHLDSGAESLEEVYTVACDIPVDPAPACSIRITDVAVGATEITITVTGAAGVVEYSLDSFDTVQETGSFPRPAPGVYLAYARDKDNPVCESYFLFAIKREYGLLYTHSFGSAFAGQITLNIYEKDYTGEVIPLEVLGGEAVRISMNGQDDDRYEGIKPLQCQVSLMARESFQYFRLYTATDRKHKLEIVSDTKGLLFIGFLLPQFYEQPYLSGTYPINLTATDGLEDLKNFDFKPSGAPMFPMFITTMEAIRFCLYQLEIDLPMYLGVNYYSEQMDTAIEPFLQSQINNRYAMDGKKSIDCYEALAGILQPYGARIFQMQGAWHVYDVEQMGKTFERRLFSSAGTLINVEAHQSTVTINTPTEGFPIFINNSQYLNVLPVYREQSIEFDYGGNFNFIKYGDFPEGSMPTGNYVPVGWNLQAYTGRTGSRGKENLLLFPDRLDGMPVNPYIESPPILFSTNAAITSIAPIRVSLKFKAPLPDVGSTPPPEDGYYMLRYSLRIGNFYATSSQSWAQQEAFIQYGVYARDTSMQESVRYFENPPADGPLVLRIYAPIATADANLIKEAVIEYESIRVEYGDFDPYSTDFEDEMVVGQNSPDISLKADPLQIRHGDTKPGVYANAIYVSEDSTSMWTGPDGQTESIQVLLLRKMLRHSERPHLKLACDIKGDISFDAVMQDTVLPKTFLPISISWDVVKGTYQCQYYEQEDTTPVEPVDELFDFELADFEEADFY